ncbi:M24 family metallopeptidase [Maritimibacter dapengensis]|uniref:Xaa-Pro peptidase family protein n=1 Tax=Maritimibacter dapengensis TaxID=2836868 RepID=A0ABS6T2R8_9RHOB|nr:Xaa-Pro peptidase family protein [Maritimibacter dapengensis]MBV7378993.1 Xaa-Pro peptidase family protein [Maritimibacter dapengensis]
MTGPARVPDSEYRDRVATTQAGMAREGRDALLLTTDADIRYVTGFLTRFWESPTRPWFVIVPATGDPVAVIPSIGANLMGQSWIDDIRTWRAPDYTDDGIGLLADALRDVTGTGEKVAVPSGRETHVRMPLADWERLQRALPDRLFTDDAGVMRGTRMVKSPLEIDLIREACAVADRAFDRVHEIAQAGTPLAEVFRRFQMLCLEEGADWVPYLAGGAGPGGYGDVISPATTAPLVAGDVLMLDTGLMRDGYFCDFDRNYSVGEPSRAVQDAHATLIDATRASFECLRPGATAAEAFHAMDRLLTKGGAGTDGGRLGHGLGMSLTEPPSLIAADDTVLQPGMVLTLEPGIETGPGRIMVHEENVVVTETGAEWLSTPQGDPIRQLPA